MRTDGGEGGVLGLVAVRRLTMWHPVFVGRPFVSLSVLGSVWASVCLVACCW